MWRDKEMCAQDEHDWGFRTLSKFTTALYFSYHCRRLLQILIFHIQIPSFYRLSVSEIRNTISNQYDIIFFEGGLKSTSILF